MSFDLTTPHPFDKVSLEELALYHLMMDERANAGLDAIQMSLSLSTTAGRHTADWMFNIYGEGVTLPTGTNQHSWSDAFYYNDHRDPSVMWEAPERIGTSYTDTGFEISAGGYASIDAAFAGWISSQGHADVILNQGTWADSEWNAIGVGVAQPVEGIENARPIYHVWFGRVEDAAGAPKVFGTSADEAFRGTAFGDTFIGKGGDDAMHGAEGRDLIKSGRGADIVLGGADNDTIKGGAGRDKIYGGDGGDTLKSGAGRDRLQGGADDDALTGSRGRDKFVFTEANFGADTITDATKRDKIVFDVDGEAADIAAFRAASDQVGNDVVYDLDGDSVNTITFQGLTLADLDTLRFDFG